MYKWRCGKGVWGQTCGQLKSSNPINLNPISPRRAIKLMKNIVPRNEIKTEEFDFFVRVRCSK